MQDSKEQQELKRSGSHYFIEIDRTNMEINFISINKRKEKTPKPPSKKKYSLHV